MKLRRAIPLVSLAAVTGVALVAWWTDPPVDYPFQDPPASGAMTDVDLGLGGRTLLGRIVDRDGSGVPEAGVVTREARRTLWTWTDANGNFTLEGLDPSPLRLLVTAVGQRATAFEVAADAETPLLLTLDRPIPPAPNLKGLVAIDLAGRIELGPGSVGSTQGYEVLLRPTAPPSEIPGGFPRRVDLTTDGRFEVPELVVGSYRVLLLGPEDRGASGPDLLSGAGMEPIVIEHRSGGDGAALELRAVHGLVRGVVADRRPEEVRATRGALVRVLAGPDPAATPEGFLFRAVRTDEAGRYEVRDLAPGTYRIRLVTGAVDRERTVVVPDRGLLDVDFEIDR